MRKKFLCLMMSLTFVLSAQVTSAFADDGTADKSSTENSASVTYNSNDAPDAAFFDKHKAAVLREELAESGVQVSDSLSLDQTIQAALQKKPRSSAALEDVQNIQDLEMIYLRDDGKVFSSEKGYIGQAELESQSSELNSSPQGTVSPLSQTNPTPDDIHGGTSGAFERRQLNFSGFDGIISNFTIPTLSSLGDGENPYMYYGFDSDSVNVASEAGYMWQKGDGVSTFPRWKPYIRVAVNGSSSWKYGTESYVKHDGDVVNNVKSYLKKASSTDSTYTLYFIVGATQVLLADSKLTSLSGVAVKRVTSIAVDVGKFKNGNEIVGKSMNARFDNLQVSLSNSDYYYPWSNYTEYKYWNTTNGKWYGTIDCTSSYIHRSNGAISIYR
ncbi:hypothetical protein [Paenibacillus sp. OAE614]|uniref:hypothetical protein n=1 Tax=Paenibacillus sp. OAE614 TaxID=2663804 RepID=UPI00178AA9AC